MIEIYNSSLKEKCIDNYKAYNVYETQYLMIKCQQQGKRSVRDKRIMMDELSHNTKLRNKTIWLFWDRVHCRKDHKSSILGALTGFVWRRWVK